MSVQKIQSFTNWNIKDLVEYRSFLYRDRNKEEVFSERAELNRMIRGVEDEINKRKKKTGEHRMKIHRDEIRKAALEADADGELFGIPKGVIG